MSNCGDCHREIDQRNLLEFKADDIDSKHQVCPKCYEARIKDKAVADKVKTEQTQIGTILGAIIGGGILTMCAIAGAPIVGVIAGGAIFLMFAGIL